MVGDSAALAGAEDAREDLLLRLLAIPPSFPTLTCDQVGQDSASDYASANGGELTEYCYNHLTGRAEVTVRVREEASGQWQYEDAAARIPVLPTCREEELPPPSPSPPPPPSPSPGDPKPPKPPKPPEPPEPETIFTCSIPGLGDFLPGPGLQLGGLRELMEPRLDRVD